MADIELGTGGGTSRDQKQSPLAERKVADQKRLQEESESESKTKTQPESATATVAPSSSPHDLISMYEELVMRSEHLIADGVSEDERRIRADNLRKLLDRINSRRTGGPPAAAPGLVAPSAPSTSPAPASSPAPTPTPTPAPSFLAHYVSRAWIEWYEARPDKVRDEIVAYCRNEIDLVKKVTEMYEAEDRSDISVLFIIYAVLGVIFLQDYFTQVNDSVDRQYVPTS